MIFKNIVKGDCFIVKIFNFRKGKASYLVLFICCILVLSACGSEEASKDGNSKNSQEDGTQSLTIALGHGLDYLGLDPYGSGRENTALRTVVFEPLALETSTGQFESALAESWTVNDAGTVWTFNLRKNVLFHDGTPFNSSAVAAAFNHYMADPEMSRRLGIENIETPDDSTVIFTLKRPFAPFLNIVGSFQCVIPSPTSFDEARKMTKPIGTGPFVLQNQSKEKVEFIANENHWREKPNLDELNVVYIADPATMVLALESGEVDLIGADGYGIPQSEIKRLQGNKDLNVVANQDSGSMEWLGFNINKGLLSDINVRKAINYAIDRQEITDYVFEGFATPAVGPIGFNQSIPWVDTTIKGYQHDQDKAKQLLAEAGWKDTNKDGYLVKEGQVLELTLLVGGDRTWKPMAEAMQNQLAEVGVKINLELRDDSVIRDLTKKGEFDMVGLGSIGKSLSDPYYFFQYYFTSRGLGAIVTNHAKLDELVAKVVSTTDKEQRSEIYNEIQQEIMNLTPGAFISHPERVTIMKNGIEGWDFSGTMDPLRFAYKVTIEE